MPNSNGFARLVAKGFDSVEETWDLSVPLELSELLEERKEAAREADTRGSGVVAVTIGEEVFHVAGYGGQGGVKYMLSNDDFLLRFRAPDTDWNISVRYLAAGLWEHGFKALQARLVECLWEGGCRPKRELFDGLKRLDYAVDFYSPEFSDQMRWPLIGAVVAPSQAKLHPWGTSERLETLTIGSKKGLEIQVYDKTREIREASGKEWMIDLWRREGLAVPEGEKLKDVWRVECRFHREYLRDRGINRMYGAWNKVPDLVAEALYSHRLTVPSADGNRRRWPMHPLWTAATDAAAGDAMVPLGRKFTMRREELRDQQIAQAAGCLRAAGVLDKGDFVEDDTGKLLSMAEENLVELAGNRGAVDRLQERYRYIDEPR